MVGGPIQQARPVAPVRVVGSTVMPNELRRTVRFKAGVRDLCFGVAILFIGVLTDTFMPVFLGSRTGMRVGGWGLIMVGTAYATYGVYCMRQTRRSTAGTAPVPVGQGAPRSR